MTSQNPGRSPGRPYGSVRDLPSYVSLLNQLSAAQLLTAIIMPDHQRGILQIQAEVDELVQTVEAFYERLGSRNWIFHDSMRPSSIGTILTTTSDTQEAEAALITYYHEEISSDLPILRLIHQNNLWHKRKEQILRAKEHYQAGQYSSCSMQLIAVMDGFVNDFEPGLRKGLAARNPDDMTAWDSVVGHHLGLTNVLRTFQKTIKSRVDEPTYELYRHGIMHGSVVNFDNVVVATKAWNMLFAVADWAQATTKARKPPKQLAGWEDLIAKSSRQAESNAYRAGFTSKQITIQDEEFSTDPAVSAANRFLENWSLKRWGLIPILLPPKLQPKKKPIAIAEVKRILIRFNLEFSQVQRIVYDTPGGAAIEGHAQVNGKAQSMRFRMIRVNPEGDLAVPSETDATWRLAVWAPHLFFSDAGPAADADSH